MHWREWKQQKREQEKYPPRPRVNKSEVPPLTPSSPAPAKGTLKDFLKGIPGYAPDANGVWIDPNIQPAKVNLYDDFQLASTLFNELSPQQRILEAAGRRTLSRLHSQSLNAVNCGILLSAALDGDIFGLA